MTDEKVELSPKMKKIYGLITIVLVAVVFSSILELASLLILKSRGEKARPFLIALPKKIDTKGFKDKRYNYIDPHLGYSQNHEIIRKRKHINYELDGFSIYRNKKKSTPSKGKNIIRIIALGGSTTDPGDANNWAKKLADVIKEKKLEHRIEIYNGGVSGYSSNQELLKMLRDCLPLQPDIVISMNGVNEVGYYHSVKGHPMVEPYQKKIFSNLTKSSAGTSPVFPNTVALIKAMLAKKKDKEDIIAGINYGPKVKTTPEAQWKRNIRIINTIAREFNIKYLCFLQPIMGFGQYQPTPPENKMLEKKVEIFKKKRIDYLGDVNGFYRQAKAISEDLDFCIDITDIFKSSNGVYRDPRHPNAKGYRQIAETVFNELEKRGLIPRNKKENPNPPTPVE
ncbi:MAG: hypothetical protein GY940_04990 [bacterium]|nr:hypothetical protein [bacterium]